MFTFFNLPSICRLGCSGSCPLSILSFKLIATSKGNVITFTIDFLLSEFHVEFPSRNATARAGYGTRVCEWPLTQARDASERSTRRGKQAGMQCSLFLRSFLRECCWSSCCPRAPVQCSVTCLIQCFLLNVKTTTITEKMGS